MESSYESKPWLESYPEWFNPTFPQEPETVLAKFLRAAQSRPDAPCMFYFDRPLSYDATKEMATSLAAALAEMGVGAGDRIMMVLQNTPQAVIASLSAWMRGAVVVPVNPMYKARELEQLLGDCDARAIICEDAIFKKAVRPVSGGRPVVTTSPLDLLADPQEPPEQLRSAVKERFEETWDFLALVERFRDAGHEPLAPESVDLAYLVYTSGTTGPPKGAMITHANIDHTCCVYQTACRLGSSDVVLAVAPLFHITGIVAHEAIAFHLGIPMVLHNRFDPEDVLGLIEKHRATFTVASITVYIALLGHPGRERHDITCFQKAYSGGAPVAPGTVEKFRNELGVTIHNVYGLTESTSPATITPLGEQGPVDADSGALSVGLIIPGLEAWITDVDNPAGILPPGVEGELVLRGPSIVSGYWQKPGETARAIRNGCFYTGDVAKIDEAGWCYIVDRKKDLINVSGYKVWPRDVEDVLYEHPGVKEAAVVGVSDSYRGETVKAYVSLNESYDRELGPDELIRFCKERMAAYKYPRSIEILDELPKTPTGKILRRNLRGEKAPQA